MSSGIDSAAITARLQTPVPAVASLSVHERDDVVRKSIRGAMALGVRQTFVHCANVAGAILLARYLSPAEFGVYAVVTFLISFLGTFGGSGLAANLIRMHDAPTDREFHAVFTFQQLTVAVLAAALWLVSPSIASFYHLDTSHAWVFRLAAASLVATSWMVPAQVQLERDLDFHKLAVIETAQAVMFNGVAVIMAFLGCGAVSFGVGLLARSLTGAVIANVVRPRCYGWALDGRAVKRHLSFGVFYQGSQFFSLLKDSITPLLVGRLIGAEGVGYISWSMMLASYPVMALMVLKRIYLPMFARFQGDRPALARCFEHVVWATTSITAPIAMALLVFVHPITTFVFGAKWEAAVPLFYGFWIANAFVPIVTPTLSALNSLGLARLPTLFAFVWMAGTWIFGWPLTLAYGILGIALSNALVQLANLALFWQARRHIPFRLGTLALGPWATAATAAAPVILVSRFVGISSLTRLVSLIAAHLVLYAALAFAMNRNRIFRLVQTGFGGGSFPFRR